MRRAGKIGGNIEPLVRTATRVAVDRIIGGDETRALLEHAVRGLALLVHGEPAGSDDATLHIIRRQRGIDLQHERCDTGDHRRRLRYP